MLIVSGARRSGTSMWMQVLEAAGLPVIGEKFPLDWRETLGELNRGGFYESTLRDGINFTTNPHPVSGVYLHPMETRFDVVKIFAEGVVHTEYAFLDRVLVSVRPWRAYAASIERLWAVEDAALGRTAQERMPRLHPALEWWRANYGLIRDVAARRYAVHFQSWPATLRAPEAVIPSVLEWLAGAIPEGALELDFDAAVEVVEPELSQSAEGRGDEGDLPGEAIETFDALFAAIDEGLVLSTALIERMSATHEQLEPRFVEHAEGYARWLESDAARRGALLSL